MREKEWCGFNYPACWFWPRPITDENRPREEDFALAAEWGFNFIRIPVHYQVFERDDAPGVYLEEGLKYIDEAIDWCEKYGLHADLNMHHLPGFGISFPGRGIPITLWTSEDMLMRVEKIWRMFARRYKSKSDLSFNLVNEPTGVDMKTYVKFIKRMTRAIREIDPDRYIMVDGINVARTPVVGIEDEKLMGQSFHMYDPPWITHLGASWTRGPDIYDENPIYPGTPPNMDKYLEKLPKDDPRRRFFLGYRNIRVDKNWIYDRIKPWIDLRDITGTFIHCGEMGVYPLKVDRKSMLNWYRDVLDILKVHRIGWALWNLRGSFGIIETGRQEFLTETLPTGDKIDAELLKLIRSYL